MRPLETAINACGGQAGLAAELGVKPQNVWNWLNRSNGTVPAEYCPAIERVTMKRGQPVTCEQLRPDVEWAVLRATPEPSHAAG